MEAASQAHYYPEPFETVLGILEEICLDPREAILGMQCQGEWLDVVVPSWAVPSPELIGGLVAVVRLEEEYFVRGWT
jgi:hypothetical protein